MARALCAVREENQLVCIRLPAAEAEQSSFAREPLTTKSADELPWPRPLDAWRALAAAPGSTEDTLVDVLHVLLTTIPERDSSRRPELSRLEQPAPPPKRTAAHPRGFRGTTYQPPKPARPETVDLRAALASRTGTAAVLESLRPHLPGALARLRERGFSPDRLETVAAGIEGRDRPCDPFLAYHLGLLERQGDIPLGFLRFAAALDPGDASSFKRLLALRGRFEVDGNQGVTAARLLAMQGTIRAVSWFELAAQLDEGSRRELLAALLEEGSRQELLSALLDVEVEVGAPAPAAYDLEIEPLLARPPRDGDPTRRVQYLRGITGGLSHEYLASGFRLLDTFGLDEELSLPRKDGPVPEELLVEIFSGMESETQGHYFAGSLWMLCGELSGFAELLAEVPWTALAPEGGFELVKLLCTLRDRALARAETDRRWRNARRTVRAATPVLRTLSPRFQVELVSILTTQLAYSTPMWAGPPERLGRALEFGRRVCREPFREPSRTAYALEDLALHDSPEVRARFLGAADRRFLRFERACSRGDLAELIAKGLEELVANACELAVSGFERCPESLARTARYLGALQRHEGPGVFRDFAAHPLQSVRMEGLEPPAVLAVLGDLKAQGIDAPLPRAIRLALESGEVVSPARWERAVRLIDEHLPRVRLQFLGHLALAALRRGLPADLSEERVRHALQMVNLLHENRRPLRRLLARYFSGERDPVLRHPLSEAWFKEHPAVDRERWLEGMSMARTLPSGPVVLSVEQDPLEALRLGTYVGSCLGINGLCSYSAASAVLDVNKRVVYARDARGSVIGRQLLAIGEGDVVVAFSVYPHSVSPELQELFLEYDLAFVSALGLPLYDGDDEPEIAHIVSSDFWHDGVWDAVAAEGASTTAASVDSGGPHTSQLNPQ